MKKILKWSGITVLGVVLLLAAGYGGLYGYTELRLRKTFDVPRIPIAISADPAEIERGEHIAIVRGCVDCHGEDLGGRLFMDAGPVGVVVASNLTTGAGGVGGGYSDTDLAAAIRHGVRPTGEALWVMPSQEYNVLSDSDVTALLSYIRSLPPVDREPGRSRLGPLGRFLYATGELPLLAAEVIDHEAERSAAPEEGPTREYGEYLAVSCTGCHSEDFSGGRIPGTPPDFPAAANITPDPESGIGGWSESDFVTALTTGKRPDGSELRPEMPWQLTAQFKDHELRALWLYLSSIPAVRTD